MGTTSYARASIGSERRRGLLLGAALGVTMMVAPGTAAAVEEATDCAAVNAGALNMGLNMGLGLGDREAERAVVLKAGDTLSFSAHRAMGTSVTLAMRASDGAWLPVPVGKARPGTALVAPGEGAFQVRFAVAGRGTAQVVVTCVPGEIAENDTLQEGGEVASAEPAKEVSPLFGASRAADFAAPSGALALKFAKRETDTAASGLDLGFSYWLWPSVMVGALAQYDQTTAPVAGLPLSLSDRAWMAGPTTTVHVAPGMALDMRAAWGSAETGALDFEPYGTSAERRLLSARLANTQEFGALKVTPSVSVNHTQETVHTALPSPVEVAMAHTVGSGRVDFGPELAYRFDLANAVFLEPKATFGGFWDFDSLSKLAPGALHGDMRLKAGAGMTLGVTDGAKLQAGAAVEEGQGTTPDVWTGRLQLSIPLK